MDWSAFEPVTGGPKQSQPGPAASPRSWNDFEAIPIGATASESPKAVVPPQRYVAPPTDDEVSAETVAQVFKGIPFLGKYVDEAGASLSAAAHPLTGVGASGESFSERKEKNLTRHRDVAAQFEAEHPVLSAGLNAGGGVAATVPMAATSVGARLLGLIGPTMRSRVLFGVGSGAAISGGDAAFRGKDDVLKQTLIGAVGGGVMPLAARGVGAAYEALANRAMRPNYAGPATGKIERALTDEGLTPPILRQRVGELGSEGMLADLGPNLRGQAEAIASTPGAGQRIVTDAMTQRGDAAAGRITSALDTAMGGPINPTAEIEAITQRRQAAAAPLYRQAYAQPVQMTGDIAEVLSTPAGKAAIARAERLSHNEGGALNANVRGLDLVQRALDDMASAAGRSGRNNEARILGGLRDRIVNEVQTQVPQWRAARQLYRSESATMDALEQGRNVFSRSVTPDELQATMRGMSAAERDAFTQGARASVSDIMGSARNDAAAARALFSKNWTPEKLNLVIGPQATTQIMDALGRETTFNATAQGILGNSRTAARQAAQKEFPGAVTDPSIPHGITAMDAALYLPRKAASMIGGAAIRNRNASVAEAAARALTATGPERDAIIRSILAAQGTSPTTAAQRALLERLTTVVGRSVASRSLSDRH